MSAAQVSRRRSITAVIVIAALIAITLVAFWPRPGAELSPLGQHSGHTASPTPLGTATPTPSPTFTEKPVDVTEDAVETPVGDTAEVSLESAASTPTGDTRDNGALGAPKEPVDPTGIFDASASLGGCTVEYGETGQCLPVYPPSISQHVQDMIDAGLDPKTMPHNWTCEEVRLYFPSGIAVRQPGVDPQALDDDGDAVACEPLTEEDATPGSDD